MSPSDPGSPASSDPGSPDRALRLFVALELPEAARSALVAFRDAAADPDVWRAVGPVEQGVGDLASVAQRLAVAQRLVVPADGRRSIRLPVDDAPERLGGR
jgi:hypothetical protein